MKKIVISQGKTILSLAYQEKMPWEKIWNDSHNKELRDSRENDPDLLLPGDIVTIPDFEPKEVDGETEEKHRFRCVTLKRGLYLELVRANGELLQNHTYRLTVGKKIYEGDCSEPIDIDLPMEAKSGLLTVLNDEGIEVDNEELKFDYLDPIVDSKKSVTGLQARLNNLGYFAGDVDGQFEEITEAIRQFQSDNGVAATGKPEDIPDLVKKNYGH